MKRIIIFSLFISVFVSQAHGSDVYDMSVSYVKFTDVDVVQEFKNIKEDYQRKVGGKALNWRDENLKDRDQKIYDLATSETPLFIHEFQFDPSSKKYVYDDVYDGKPLYVEVTLSDEPYEKGLPIHLKVDYDGKPYKGIRFLAEEKYSPYMMSSSGPYFLKDGKALAAAFFFTIDRARK